MIESLTTPSTGNRPPTGGSGGTMAGVKGGGCERPVFMGAWAGAGAKGSAAYKSAR